MCERCKQLESIIKRVLEGFDAGVWVRNTSGDNDPAWAIKQFKHFKALGDAAQAVVTTDLSEVRQ